MISFLFVVTFFVEFVFPFVEFQPSEGFSAALEALTLLHKSKVLLQLIAFSDWLTSHIGP